MRNKLFVGMMAACGLPAADLPVRQVQLYKHGVGYFERSGRLAPGESARLDFKASEMDDVLKSLTIEEKGGGKISGLRYDSSQPLERKLSEFPFSLGQGQPLSALLDQLKGARIELKYGSETISGVILAARLVSGEEKRPEIQQLTMALDSGELRNLDLSAATSIRFPDPVLQAQLRDYLAALTNSGSKEKRSVYIDSTDKQGREIVASYIIPAPVWKSSYRLILGETAQALLEGWAIVDNTTGEDWTNVRLSLISGRPISFLSRLYEPRYVTRPVAELPEDRPQAPLVDQGVLEAEKKPENAPGNRRDAFGGAGPRPLAAKASAAPMAMMEERVAVAQRENMESSIGPTALSREAGELFEYRIPSPVTVRKTESAMLPFLQQKTAARKLSIYTDRSSAHPLNAAEVTNSTGKTLDGGPITVFDSDAYAGEALMETLKNGDKRLVSYGLDLGTRITTLFDSKGALVREIHVNRGTLTTRLAAQQTTTYTIRNVDQKPKTLIVEHPVQPQFNLLDAKPCEKTANACRFEIKLAAGANEKFPVSEERVYENSFAVSNLTPDMLLGFVQNKSLSAASRKQLEQILEQKRQIASIDAESKRVESERNDISRDQERIRQNINSLNQVSGQQSQVQNYAKQLEEQERRLATLRDRSAALQKDRAAAEARLNALIEKMEF